MMDSCLRRQESILPLCALRALCGESASSNTFFFSPLCVLCDLCGEFSSPRTQHLAPRTSNPALLTLTFLSLTIKFMTSHKDYRLDQLGIASQYEADQLERDLDVRFDHFTYYDREVWVQQNSYLDAYADTGTVSDAADAAGITISTTHEWQFLNIHGFKHRLEDAVLRFSDSVQVLALQRAREPNAPASLLIALLRAHVPEKYSSNGHLCDTSKADQSLLHYSQDTIREKEAGYPYFRAITDGTHDSPTHTTPSAPSATSAVNPHHDIQPLDPDEVDFFNLSPNDTPPVGAGFNPAHDPSPAGEHTANPNLSPAGGETQRGGSSPTTPTLSASSATSAVSPPAPPAANPHDDIQPLDPDEVDFFNLSNSDTPPVGAGFRPAHDPSEANPPTPSPVLGEGGGEGKNPPSASSASSAVSPSHKPQNPEPSTQNPIRRPIASLFQKARPHPDDDDPNTFKTKRF